MTQPAPECVPGEEWRERDGWHYLQINHEPKICRWRYNDGASYWLNGLDFDPVEAHGLGYRYLAPVPSFSEIAALVQAANLARGQINALEGVLNHPNYKVTGWHLNGSTEPVENFFKENDFGAVDALSTALSAFPNPQPRRPHHPSYDRGQTMSENRNFNGLLPHQTEALALLAEECAEVIQIIGKVLRHGYNSRHPNGGKDNSELLATEMGHIFAAAEILHNQFDVSCLGTEAAKEEKLKTIGQWLHHVRLRGKMP